MTGEMRFEFAIQEPALAIAPVFLVLKKSPRAKLDVTFKFGTSTLQWRGADALGIPEQSVLLALLSIAGQQPFSINPNSAVGDKAKLFNQLSCVGPQCDVAVVKAHWRKIEIAAGYSAHSGKNVANIKLAVKRLAETTIWECRDGIKYESRLLSWICGNDNGVIIALNRRATDAIYGHQFIKISLDERNTLPDESAKALHAYLSGSMRAGSTRSHTIDKLQAHIWSGEATGSTRRSRNEKLRRALLAIDQLPSWRCASLPRGQVEITRIDKRTILSKTADDGRAQRSLSRRETTPSDSKTTCLL